MRRGDDDNDDKDNDNDENDNDDMTTTSEPKCGDVTERGKRKKTSQMHKSPAHRSEGDDDDKKKGGVGEGDKRANR